MTLPYKYDNLQSQSQPQHIHVHRNTQRGGESTEIQPAITTGPTDNVTPTISAPPGGLPDSAKLLIGAGGIYAAFLYYGSLQEDVFRYTAEDGSQFKAAWFLQVLEALANVVIGFVGMKLMGKTKGIPLKMFGISGASQVTAKACTSLALANGLSFPVATLAKSGKMAPVMAGSLLLGGATYSVREYLQVAAIIGGTAIVSMGKKKGDSASNSAAGVIYIVLSLIFDGVTGGFQKRLKAETAKAGVKPKPYDFMFWTNLFMCLTATLVGLSLGEFTSGLAFTAANPEIVSKIIKFALCSAVGQSFIFYTIANFDPLILTTVTTTRKIFSVLLSIFLKGHSLSGTGWSGIALACGGILSEMQAKASGKSKRRSH
jgi:UDP-galactose transporter B1